MIKWKQKIENKNQMEHIFIHTYTYTQEHKGSAQCQCKSNWVIKTKGAIIDVQKTNKWRRFANKLIKNDNLWNTKSPHCELNLVMRIFFQES